MSVSYEDEKAFDKTPKTKIKTSDKFTVEILEEWWLPTEDSGADLKQVIAKIKFYDDEFKIFANTRKELAVKIGKILADIGVA